MIVPSIDLVRGEAVQLVGGERHALTAGDPRPLAARFGRVGEVAVVDLDAARGEGNNSAIVEALCRLAPCRVGGGIRSAAAARRWLARGASRVVVGTAADPDVLADIPPESAIVALDARHGEVVVEGWRRRTGRAVEERMRELAGLTSEFVVTFVEREGRLAGVDLERVAALRDAAAPARLTVAGGIRSAADIAALDRLGVDAQVGMALYTDRIGLTEGFAAPLVADRADGLWPTVVTDELGIALGLAWSSPASLEQAIESGHGVYHSRARGLWVKGSISGATQELLRVEADCDRDALRFTVRQRGPGFCHRNTATCWGGARGLQRLEATIHDRLVSDGRTDDIARSGHSRPETAGVPAGRTTADTQVGRFRRDAAPSSSYTALLGRSPALLATKLRAEADELARAGDRESVRWEAADLLYFTLVAMGRAGVSLAEVAGELDRRAALGGSREDRS
ncbi:MAG: phosphoribosyl-ATP diphosphatase [Thermoanaerobaculia bacterium]